MTITEAIKQFEGAEVMLLNRNFSEFNQAITMAVIALREKAERENPQPLTNAGHIRSMGDKQLAHFIHQLVSSDFFCRICQRNGECWKIAEDDSDIPDGWCEESIREWLLVPFDEKPAKIFDGKQESGLLEED